VLENAYEHNRGPDAYGMGSGLEASWKENSYGLTYEDYWIYVCILGHEHYRKYNEAHWRDVDITTGMDVWNELRNTEPKWVKAVSL
jgi:hypothetical protein